MNNVQSEISRKEAPGSIAFSRGLGASSRMLKVCIVVENHPHAIMGGAQFQAHLLAEELVHRPGVLVTYLARRVMEQEHGVSLPYQVRRIGSVMGFRHRAVLFDAADLWRTLSVLEPDVIYQRMKQSYTGVCALYAKRRGIPFFFQIASESDLDLHWIRRRRPSLNLPLDVLEHACGNWGLRRATHIIAQTERQHRLLYECFGRSAVQVIRNFQPLPQSLPAKEAGVVRVLWIGNLKDVKRPHLFVQLAESFAGRRDVEFLMVGRPSKNRRFAPLMQKIQHLSNLKYLGFLPNDQVNALMETAAIHVSTSSFEGFPNTFIQAWARGAIVASLSVDVDEGMEEQGIGVCAGSFDRLRTVVDELVRNHAGRAALAERAFAYVHRNHSLSNAARLADLLVAAGAGAGTKSEMQ